MFNIALFEPEIPPNTGNIIRLCANTGCQLHLIKPLGFELTDKRMRRAGLDYHEFARVRLHEDYNSFISTAQAGRLFACSTRGKQNYAEARFQPGDTLLFGPETRGLPQWLLDPFPAGQVLRIPMLAGNRSLNLANAVAIITYEAWRQQNFEGIAL